MSDLRQWLAQVEALGELRGLSGVPWDLEMGTILEMLGRQWDKPAVLFDDIPGYPSGYRVLVNPLGSRRRFALAVGLPPEMGVMDMVQEWRRRYREIRPLPPRFVDGGPVMENGLYGEEVDIFKLPVPKWHEHDGGRFIGTADMVITQEREGPWVNAGTYRVQVHDRNHVGVLIAPTHHGSWHMQEWHERGEAMPVAIVVGMEPLLFLASAIDVPIGLSELDYAGAIRGEPIEVIKGPVTGLPIPAAAEIVLEGFIEPGEGKLEGPFGEFTGYYASGARPQPVVRVEAIHYRNNPILLGAPPLKPPEAGLLVMEIPRAALLWDVLEEAGVPNVKGIWCYVARGFLMVVSIKQRYLGHAKQAARIACQYRQGGVMGRFYVVVDEDIDVTDLDEVLWAMCTRVDPDKDIEILPECTSSALDPLVRPEDKGDPAVARVVIDATRPFKWRDRFPEVVASSPELRQQVLSRWGEALKGII